VSKLDNQNPRVNSGSINGLSLCLVRQYFMLVGFMGGNWPTVDNWPWFHKNWPMLQERLSHNTLQKVELLLKIYVKDLIITKPVINPFSESTELRT
jgi:hypothetical protein